MRSMDDVRLVNPAIALGGVLACGDLGHQPGDGLSELRGLRLAGDDEACHEVSFLV